MSEPSSRIVQPLVPARLKTPATLFVCTKCSGGKARRRDLKDAIKAAGRKRALRVVGCGCLDVCPKRGTMTVLTAGGSMRCAIIADAAGADDALALLDERVGDTISD